jgi:hypothetical protein
MSRGRFFFAPFAFRNFFAIDDHVARRFDADTHLGTIDRHDRHFDVITNSEGFACSACEYQHGFIYARAYVGCE